MSADDRPNILWIVSDDHGWSDYGFMGHPHIATPHLDRLAATSLTFVRGYTPVPLCRPSLATMLTGQYPHQHGVTGNDPQLPDRGRNAMAERLNPRYAPLYQSIVDSFARQPNLIRSLSGTGYRSLQTGKWWEGSPVATAGFTQGMTAGNARGDRHGGDGLAIGREGLQPIRDFITADDQRPWLVWYAPMLPHTPHTPPARLLQKYLPLAPSEPVARYWACVEWFDETCGELLDFVDQQGQSQRTIVIYVCDNGWIQSPERANLPAPRSKLSPYEGGIRTPIMIHWPSHVAPRIDDQHLASTVDLWPTLASLLDAPCPAELSGIDLTNTAQVAKRTAIFGEQYTHNILDIEHPTRGLEHRWVISSQWKLIVNQRQGQEQLFKLGEDPTETTDLAATEPDVTLRLRQLLDEHWRPSKQ